MGKNSNENPPAAQVATAAAQPVSQPVPAFPNFAPGQQNAIVQQLQAGYGGQASDLTSYMNAIYPQAAAPLAANPAATAAPSAAVLASLARAPAVSTSRFTPGATRPGRNGSRIEQDRYSRSGSDR